MAATARRLPLALALVGCSLVIATLLIWLPPSLLEAAAAAGGTRRPLTIQFFDTGAGPGVPSQRDTSDGAGFAGRSGESHQPELPLLQCAIYNNVPWHMDVAAGMAWAFQEAGCHVTCYLHSGTRGVQDVMASWFSGRFRKTRHMIDDAAQYDVIIMITFTEGPPRSRIQKQLLRQHKPPHQRFLLVVHNPDLLYFSRWVPRLLLEEVVGVHVGQQAGREDPGGQLGQADQQEAQAGREDEELADAHGHRQHQRRRRLASWAWPGAATSAAAPVGDPSSGLPPPLPLRAQLVTLAPTVANYTRSQLESWAAALLQKQGGGQASLASSQLPLPPRVEVPWMAPVVPWRPSFAGGSFIEDVGGANIFRGRHSLQHLCIQGNIESKRRNYAAAFAAAAHPAVVEQLQRHNESLLLVGRDKGERLEIPEALQPHVRVLADLPYQEYYDTLARCRAILTAFKKDVYLINKTSSSIAAALQVGSPILAEERVMAAYTYLQQDVVFSYRAPHGAVDWDPSAVGAATAAQLLHIARVEAAHNRRRLGQGMNPATHAAGAQGSTASAAAEAAQSAGEGGPPIQLPEPGSYSHAMLAAFVPGASRAAHTAARRLKKELMQHNVQVATQFLQDTAAAAAAAAAATPHAAQP